MLDEEPAVGNGKPMSERPPAGTKPTNERPPPGTGTQPTPMAAVHLTEITNTAQQKAVRRSRRIATLLGAAAGLLLGLACGVTATVLGYELGPKH